MMTTLVGGPKPAGFRTCSETRYWVNGVRPLIRNWPTSGSLMKASEERLEALECLGR